MTRFRAVYDAEAAAERALAQNQNHTRLLAIAWCGEPGSIGWKSFPDEAAMQKFLDARDAAPGLAINLSIAVAAINPQDSEETIRTILNTRPLRPNDGGSGYFAECM